MKSMKIIVDLNVIVKRNEAYYKVKELYQKFCKLNKMEKNDETLSKFIDRYIDVISENLEFSDVTEFRKYFDDRVILNVEELSNCSDITKNKLVKKINQSGIQYNTINFGSLVKKCQETFVDVAITDSEEDANILSSAIEIVTKNVQVLDNENVYKCNDEFEYRFMLDEIRQKTPKQLVGKPSIDKPWLKYYPKAGVTAEFEKKSIYDLLVDNNEKRKNFTALNYFGRKIKYDELLKKVDETAAAFKKLGVKKGDIVTACVVNTPEVVYTLYALNKLGAVLNVIDPRTTPEGIKNYLNEVNSKYVVTIDPLYKLIDSSIELQNQENKTVENLIIISPNDSLPLVLNGLSSAKDVINKKDKTIYKKDRDIKWKDFIKNSKNETVEKVEFEENRPAIIVHTGGTTGTPKGVVISNESMNNMVTQHDIADLGFEPGQVYLNILVPFVAYGLVMATHLPLCLSMEVALIPSFDPEKFADLFIKYKPNNVLGIPSYFSALKNSPKKDKLDFSNLNFAAVGGDPISPEVLKDLNEFTKARGFKHQIHTGYGMTEACSGACCTRDRCYVEGSVGIPLPREIVSVFEPGTHNELGYNQQGEICLSGDTLMKEYYDNAEETKSTLQLHEDGLYWVHTGDIGKVTEDGVVFIDGRIKRMIISSGFKIFPPALEKVLYKHPAVKQCVVISAPHPEHINVPIALIILKDNMKNEEESIKNDIIELCKKELAEYQVPYEFIFRNDFPLTNIGKVDYKKLEEEYKNKVSFEKNMGDNKILKNTMQL